MNIKKLKVKFLLLAAFCFIGLTQTGCGVFDEALNNVSSLVGLSETATVIANTAQIRSSYAVVAADLLEVKRGDKLEVLEQIEFEKILWLRVRASDEDNTEGWIEAQNVITSNLLEKSKALAAEFKDLPPQAAGQLRAASNLRLAPDMKSENLLFKLANGSTFEVMDWKFVPKEQNAAEVDDSAKGEQKQAKTLKNEEIEAAKEIGEPEKLDEKYDVWYQVRLDPSISPAPAGWLFGRQVELQVPNDIIFFQENDKKFVTWYRLDNDTSEKGASKDTTKSATPGSWIILTRTNIVKAIDGVEPDFDGIIVLGYDKYDQNHYSVYRSGSGVLWGLLPLKVEGTGDNKSFSVQLRNNNGEIQEKRFVVFKDKNRMRLTPPEDMAQYESKPVR
ncbi:MAG: hypothetical protein JWN60_1926 [Acidobacteria bacterium]|jgi:hypothetical protein|nr:hypothetical protein [Acidobacteriota bacterium]